MQAQALTLPPPCFTDVLVCFGSEAGLQRGLGDNDPISLTNQASLEEGPPLPPVFHLIKWTLTLF